MQQDSDFAAYLAARWPALVRTVALLGCPRSEAEDVVRDALARCHGAWERERQAGDIDVRVHEALLEAVARSARRRRQWEPPGLGQPQPVLDLVPGLDRLTVPVRAALVLEAVAGLDATQVARVVGTTTGEPGSNSEPADVRDAAAAIDVLAPPIEAVVTRARDHRRRRLRMAAGATTALLVLVGLGVWAGIRTAPAPAAAQPHVTRAQNLAEVAWWANGVLHLPKVEVELPRVTDLVEVGEGAVIGDEQGTVSWVNDDGEVSRIGHKMPRAPLVASDEHGWAVWVDPRGRAQASRLVVWDLAAQQEVAHQDLPADGPFLDRLGQGAFPVAVDGTHLYYADADGEWSWKLPDSQPAGVRERGMLDVAQGTRAWTHGPGIHVEQSIFSIAFDVPGTGAQLSPAGEYLLTRLRTEGGDQLGTPRIYDTRSGDELWTGLAPGDLAVAATLGPDDEVTYVVAHTSAGPPAGEGMKIALLRPYELRTCHLGERTCFTVTTFPHAGPLPVLAH